MAVAIVQTDESKPVSRNRKACEEGMLCAILNFMKQMGLDEKALDNLIFMVRGDGASVAAMWRIKKFLAAHPSHYKAFRNLVPPGPEIWHTRWTQLNSIASNYYGPNSLELELLEPRTNRRPVFDFEPMDTLPTVEHIIQARQSSLWHVRRIFLEHFPTLAAKFKADLGDVPVIRAIPLHQSEHLPTPAMKIDESSLDGTIDVIDTTVTRTLQLTAAGMRAHGVMFAGGDLLSLNLTDKAIAARREDTELLDAYGSYLKGMLGIFHVKLSGTRGTVNEHWGKPNSKFHGSLWTQNSFLSRKSISVGWVS
ncbi:hypothetical protein B0H10DRAFT_2379996 [Mycena sp. CBHHK59/15]|nr:hypothetical protein B0H10DRAFT_2379996 [Mycena sp. CBHHK59/15]